MSASPARTRRQSPVEAGASAPLGATIQPGGVNFSVYSKHATLIELVLFDDVTADEPSRVIPLDPARHRSYHYWHGLVPQIGAGQVYGFRAHGPFAPERGLRFDAEKLLLDPYARAVSVPSGYDRHAAGRPGNNTATAMRSVVVDPSRYDWEGDVPLTSPIGETVIYELHVGAMTQHPNSGVAPEKRGTFAGLIEKIPYLKDLGVDAVELLPVFQFDRQDVPPGLVNFWGYQPVSFFAPHQAYGSRNDPLAVVDEFRDMVKALHRAGIEVILDVVFNHTSEGGQNGPTLCYRGLANDVYYILEPDKSRYSDYSGCGNTLNANHSIVRRLIQDSLRYWVTEMHVDGFRFDLASILSRDENGVPLPNPPILWDIESDPLLTGTKLIAEAWDAAGLYQVGRFVGDTWQEWNGRFRDDVRRFVRADNNSAQGVATRLLGSPDLFGHEQREAEQSINFVTCHDGFTLNDLVSYNEKHNEANGEDNRDGDSHNRSWNHGVEGLTDDAEIDELRRRQRRNFVTTLLLSQGVPMLLGGDELGRTQHGNNNAYCQDNEVSWYDWEHEDEELRDWFARLVAYRAAHPVFRRRRWFQGRQIRGIEDMAWFRPDAGEMSDDDWEMGFAKSVGVFVNGDSIQTTDMFGGRIVDDSFMIVFNAGAEPLPWKLPNVRWGVRWVVDLDTADPLAGTSERTTVAFTPNAKFTVPARSMLVLRRTEAVAKDKHPSARRRKPPP